MRKSKLNKESKGISKSNGTGVNSTDLLEFKPPKEIDPAVDGTWKDYFFGNLRRLKEFIEKIDKNNIDEIKPRLQWFIDAALSWESTRLED